MKIQRLLIYKMPDYIRYNNRQGVAHCTPTSAFRLFYYKYILTMYSGYDALTCFLFELERFVFDGTQGKLIL